MSKQSRIEETREQRARTQKAKLSAEFNHLNTEIGKLDIQLANLHKMRDEMDNRMGEIWCEVDEIV